MATDYEVFDRKLRAVIVSMLRYEPMTCAELSRTLGVSNRVVQRRLLELCEVGQIRPSQERAGVWVCCH